MKSCFSLRVRVQSSVLCLTLAIIQSVPQAWAVNGFPNELGNVNAPQATVAAANPTPPPASTAVASAPAQGLGTQSLGDVSPLSPATIVAVSGAVPVALGGSRVVGKNTTTTIALGFTDADTPVENITYEILTQPAHGSVFKRIGSDSRPFQFRYQTSGFVGLDQFTYRVKDNTGNVSNPVTMFLRVGTAPTVRTALADFQVNEDSAVRSIDLTQVFTDADFSGATLPTNRDSLTYTVTATVPTGLLQSSMNAGGILNLNFLANQNGSAIVTVRATDLSGQFIEDEFRVTVNPVDDAPVVTQALPALNVLEDAADTTLDLSQYFRDGDSPLTYSVLSNTNSRLITPSLAGAVLTLDYRANRNGAAQVTIQACGGARCVQSAFGVNVSAVNDVPVISNAIAPVQALTFDDPRVIDLSSVFSDADVALGQDSLTYSILSNSNSGLVEPSVNSLTGRLSLDFLGAVTGTATVRVRATDRTGAFRNASFSVAVAAAPTDQLRRISANGQDLTLSGNSIYVIDAASVGHLTISSGFTGRIVSSGSEIAISGNVSNFAAGFRINTPVRLTGQTTTIDANQPLEFARLILEKNDQRSLNGAGSSQGIKADFLELRNGLLGSNILIEAKNLIHQASFDGGSGRVKLVSDPFYGSLPRTIALTASGNLPVLILDDPLLTLQMPEGSNAVEMAGFELLRGVFQAGSALVTFADRVFVRGGEFRGGSGVIQFGKYPGNGGLTLEDDTSVPGMATIRGGTGKFYAVRGTYAATHDIQLIRGIFIAPAEFEIQGSNFNVQAQVAFNANAGVVRMTGGTSYMHSALNLDLYRLVVQKNDGSFLQLEDTVTWNMHTLELLDGRFVGPGIFSTKYLVNQASFDGGDGRVVIVSDPSLGTSNKQIALAAGGLLPTLILEDPRTNLMAPEGSLGLTLGGFELRDGTFTARSAPLTITQRVLVSGGEFIGGSGSVTFAGGLTLADNPARAGVATIRGRTGAFIIPQGSYSATHAVYLTQGNFYAPALLTLEGSDLEVSATAQFVHNNGRVEFTGRSSRVRSANPLRFYDLTVNKLGSTSFLELLSVTILEWTQSYQLLQGRVNLGTGSTIRRA